MCISIVFEGVWNLKLLCDSGQGFDKLGELQVQVDWGLQAGNLVHLGHNCQVKVKTDQILSKVLTEDFGLDNHVCEL